ncbi:MAG: hypothetical protein PHQ32_05630 [Firmicutes bacterium]|nr:hypothetical protein [Bacillota bacterium]
MEQKQEMDRKIVIGHLFKEQLNSYGDAGNVEVLKTRLLERHIEVEVREYAINENIEFDELDIIYIGGGKNREKRLVADCLRDWLVELKEYIDSGKPLLVTGSSLSLFGKTVLNQEEEIPGLGILDFTTKKLDDEIKGQTVLDIDIEGRKLALIGYQNLKEQYVYANEDLTKKNEQIQEGLLYKRLVGTTLHGPVLAKNKELADILIKWAGEKKFDNFKLVNLNDPLEIKYRKLVVKKNV